MRASLPVAASLVLLFLSSCGESGAPITSGTEVAAGPIQPLLGAFKAQSETAHAVTGDVAIERAGLIFDNGVTLYTRELNARRGHDLIKRDGESYAAAAVGPSARQPG